MFQQNDDRGICISHFRGGRRYLYRPRIVFIQEEEDKAGNGRSFSAGYVPDSSSQPAFLSVLLLPAFPSAFQMHSYRQDVGSEESTDDRSYDGTEGLGVLAYSIPPSR